MTIEDAIKNAVEYKPLEAKSLPKDDAVISELAKLPQLQYGQQRKGVAKILGVTVALLDQLVKEKRDAMIGAVGGDTYFTDVKPWHEPVDGAGVLDELVGAFERFVALSPYSATALALWCMHAHVHAAADISPILAVLSPEKRCGKTTTMKVISGLVPRPMHAINVSTSVLFRVVEEYVPTMLIDEADNFLKRNDELRGMLNGGHDRMSAHVWRSVGDDHQPRAFNVWAPKAIAMIGRLPDTLEDRAIVVHLRRRLQGEKVERFRAHQIGQFAPVREKAARWEMDNHGCIAGHDPDLPEELNDRQQDNWRPLIAIADIAGGHWPETARTAAVALSSEAANDEDRLSFGVRLLQDMHEIMSGLESIQSTTLVEALHKIEDAPWPEWRHGNPISATAVARLLRSFGIRPHKGKGCSVYRASDLQDAWDRYVEHSSPQPLKSKCELATCDQGATKKPLKIKVKSQVADGGSLNAVAGGKCDGTATLTPDEIKHHL